MPTVSVIIPTYNRAGFLAEAIESVLSQSYQDFELIIIDDGSEDQTREVVRSFGDGIVYHFQPNAGISSARNRGLECARGTYIAFLDSDDLWKRHKLRIQMEFFEEHPESLICYTDEVWIRKGIRVNQKKIHRKYSGWIFPRCLPLCIISLSSAVMHTDLFAAVGAFDESLPACEDYDLWLRVSLYTPIHFLPEHLIIKRGGHADQLSHAYWGMDRFRISALEKILGNPRLTSEQRELVTADIARRCDILVAGSRKRGKTDLGVEYEQKRHMYKGMSE